MIPKGQRGQPLSTDTMVKRNDFGLGRRVRHGRLRLTDRSQRRKGLWPNHGQKQTRRAFTVPETPREIRVRIQHQRATLKRVTDGAAEHIVFGVVDVTHESVQLLVTCPTPTCYISCKGVNRVKQVKAVHACGVQNLHDDACCNRCQIPRSSPILRCERVLIEPRGGHNSKRFNWNTC